MDYKHHMMGKKCIRIHAMTHFRKHILKEMMTNQPNCGANNGFVRKNYTCYVCGIRDATSSYIINHLGVYHKRLDFYNSFVIDIEYSVDRPMMDTSTHMTSQQLNNSVIALDGFTSSYSSTDKETQVLKLPGILLAIVPSYTCEALPF